jgi:hypothetical protein
LPTVLALTSERHHQAPLGVSVMRSLSGIQFTSKSRSFLSAVVFSAFAIYSAQIVVKELVEGHVSTSRSWRAVVVIGVLALVAAWRAVRSWRKVRESRQVSL